MSKQLNVLDASSLREFSGLNQTEFWQAVGITQSGGSRYEAGRKMPKSVVALLRLVYIEKLDLDRVRREDVELVEYLRAEKKDTYDKLRREAKAWVKRQPMR
jgi:transcriptional regulator with XRE-family HTH domain